jgi:regulatory protein
MNMTEPANLSTDPGDPAKPENKELLSRALALLSRRDVARAEFVGKLTAAGYDKAEVAAAADWCEAQGFLSETRFVEGAARRLSSKYGANRVAHSLRDKGVSDEAIAGVMPDLKDSDLARARAIWSRRFHHPPADQNEKARQVRFLQSRGFSYATIKLVILGEEEPGEG